MDNQIVNMRILPYVRTVTIKKKGREILERIDNLSSSEVSKMSVKMPKIFERNSEGIYVLDVTSVTFKGTGLRMLLAFDYNELTDEEKAKYFDRTVLIPVIKKESSLKEDNTKKTKKRVRN